MKFTGIILAAISVVAFIAPAQAAIFTITRGATSFSFTIPDGTTPDNTFGNGKIQYFDIAAASTTHLMTINLYDPANFSRQSLEIEDQDTGATLYNLFGAKLFDGDLSAPTFRYGDYQLTNRNGQTTYSLSIRANATAAVPEPASWAMMIGGFALVGGALRRRSANVVRASFA